MNRAAFATNLACCGLVIAAALLVGSAATHAQSGAAAFGHKLPPPGWIGDHRDAWVAGRAVYKSACRSTEVDAEERLLRRIIATDEYRIALSGSPAACDAAVAQPTQGSKESVDGLSREIDVIDALVVQLRLLPGCDIKPPAMAAIVIGGPAPAPVREASADPTAAMPLSHLSDSKPAPQAPVTSAATQAAAPAASKPVPQDTATAPSRSAALRHLVIRFDERRAALTPAGIRAFDAAVAALRAGKAVTISIAGCGATTDFSNGSSCARRLYSLESRLAAAGIVDPGRLFADLR